MESGHMYEVEMKVGWVELNSCLSYWKINRQCLRWTKSGSIYRESECPRDFVTPWTVPGILQARILEWVAYPFSSGSSQPSYWTRVSCIAGGFFTTWATREAWKYLYTHVIQSYGDKYQRNHLLITESSYLRGPGKQGKQWHFWYMAIWFFKLYKALV